MTFQAGNSVEQDGKESAQEKTATGNLASSLFS